jgi:2-polyprenyl-3-methyl-5-hydroxy-6-metoxy-1,4-benzoquinol methylase
MTDRNTEAERAEYDRLNRTYWDQLTMLHRAGDGYRVQQFLGGASILDPLVLSEIGDVAGKSIVHLQCHFGLDTLSLARLGAIVTGIDYAPEGIATARRLSAESGVSGSFIESRVEDLPDRLDEKFDIAYVTWGALNWLPDLGAWARTVAHVLKPGGFLYLAEFHPLAQAIDEQETGANGSLAIHYPMIGKSAPRQWQTETDYADEVTKLTHTGTWEWNHGVGELLSSLIGAGLRIDYFKEHPYLTWRAFAAMVEIDKYFFGLPNHLPAVPLAISLKAAKV